MEPDGVWLKMRIRGQTPSVLCVAVVKPLTQFLDPLSDMSGHKQTQHGEQTCTRNVEWQGHDPTAMTETQWDSSADWGVVMDGHGHVPPHTPHLHPRTFTRGPSPPQQRVQRHPQTLG